MASLFYENPYARCFDARILWQAPQGEGLLSVVLADTAFYPGGGGQPCDLGQIQGCEVISVHQDGEGGPIVHHVRSASPLPEQVHCRLNWQRRYDHMQQHTGQHLLSYALADLFGAHSLGLHIGQDDAYVDLRLEGVNPLPEGWMQQAEQRANELVQRAIPVRQFFPSQAELAALPLRKKPDFHEHLRVVHIGPEAVACGGVHVDNSAQVRLVRILKSQQSHGNLRVVFLCGERAATASLAAAKLGEQSAALLSCGTAQLPEMLQRLKDSERALSRQLWVYQKNEAVQALLPLAQQGANDRCHLVALAEGLAPGQLNEVALALLGQGIDMLCLGVGNGDGHATVVVAAGQASANAKGFFEQLAKEFGGRGGGRSDFAQGRLHRFDAAAIGQMLEAWLQ